MTKELKRHTRKYLFSRKKIINKAKEVGKGIKHRKQMN